MTDNYYKDNFEHINISTDTMKKRVDDALDLSPKKEKTRTVRFFSRVSTVCLIAILLLGVIVYSVPELNAYASEKINSIIKSVTVGEDEYEVTTVEEKNGEKHMTIKGKITPDKNSEDKDTDK